MKGFFLSRSMLKYEGASDLVAEQRTSGATGRNLTINQKARRLPMIHITDSISLHESEIQFVFIKASGPGGQNVNKVSSAVQLRFDSARSPALNADVRRRLRQIAGRRMTAEGILIIEARRYRSQDRNREDAVDRLIRLIRQAAEKPRRRRPTKPSTNARQKRLTAKRQRGQIKRRRRSVHLGDEDA